MPRDPCGETKFLESVGDEQVAGAVTRHVGDPLLVRNGRGYERTVRGERVLRGLESLMPRLEDMVRGEQFDPTRSREIFCLAMSDHASMIVLPSLLASLRKGATHIKLEVSAAGAETYEDVAAGRINTFLCAEEAPSSLESEMLFTLDFVCLVGAALPIRARRLALKQYLEFQHVLVEIKGGATGSSGSRSVAAWR